MKRIVWLASFPRSGNTWLRLLLANYFSPGAEVNFNDLSVGVAAGARRIFDEWSAIDSSELTDEEIMQSRGDLFRAIAACMASSAYFKTHEAWTRSVSGDAVFPADVTLAAVYVVRHPFDVAVSMSHFLDTPVANAIRLMGSDAFTLLRDPAGISVTLPQRVMSWSRNVTSWIVESGLPIRLVKYEDLRADTASSLTSVLRQIGVPADQDQVARAVQLTNFDRLQQKERTEGFRESPPKPSLFFRGGRVGDGSRELSAEQQQELLLQHGPVMRQLGYL